MQRAPQPISDKPAQRPVVWLLVGSLVTLVGLAGFSGWFANGDTLFWSLLQAGLAWCL